MDRSKVFLQHLYKEKEIHKEHRHKHVIYKLVLTGSFFGLGQFTNERTLFALFLYVVPFIALVHDVYIIGEHLKVQRVGRFIKYFEGIKNTIVCPEEIIWETYTSNNRELWAYKASLLYSALVSIFSSIAIYEVTNEQAGNLYIGWVLLWVLFLFVVWFRAAQLELKLKRIGSGKDEADQEIKRQIEELLQADGK